ncbi:MAG: hypothetical protein M3P45_07275, partial [Acidobacteriota bacterium]|nr:hypothetical protein [Acidobacteriota bacterium]
NPRPGDAKFLPRNDGVCGTQRLVLDFPHYTRPAEYRGWKVPEVLIGGNHADVAAWRRDAALEKAQRNRPDIRLGTRSRMFRTGDYFVWI